MAKSLRESVKQLGIQQESLDDLESVFPKEVIDKWLAALRAWEDDFGESPNPFHEEDRGSYPYRLAHIIHLLTNCSRL